MAGDWIKMRTSLLSNPKVNRIARALESDPRVCRELSNGHDGPMSNIVTRTVMRHVTVSSLLVTWGAANEHTHDGVFQNTDLSDIDDMVGIPGFGAAMEAVGWAIYDQKSNTVTLPNFGEYNTSSNERSAAAKTGAERQKKYRLRLREQEQPELVTKDAVTNSVTCDVTGDVTCDVCDVTMDVTCDVTRDRREEKRRIDKNIAQTVSASKFSPIDFLANKGAEKQLCNDWLRVRKEKRLAPTKTALESVVAEVEKSGLPINDALRLCCERGWGGFRASWLSDQSSVGINPWERP